jgi:hypothetical protein
MGFGCARFKAIDQAAKGLENATRERERERERGKKEV